MQDSQDLSRREFIRSATLAGAGLGVIGALGTRELLAAPDRKGKSVMGLKTAPMERVRIGVVGIGNRGSEAVRRLSLLEGVEITSLCDIRPQCVAGGQKTLKAAGKPVAKEYGKTPDDWKKMAESPDVDLVYACTPWELHTPQAVFSMLAGKHAVTEVPIAVTLEECWQLVDTAERTQRHCMMLENCCYGETELMILNMCRQGVFGELLHGEAAYLHDLREQKMSDTGYQGMWRLEHSKKRNGNVYPTHGLGPVSQYMSINRGDRFDYLVSMSTRERGLTLWAESHFPPDDARRKATYKLGDLNTSLIHSLKGRTVMVQHDTSNPRPYSRINLISGTKGCFADYPPRLALEPNSEGWLEGDKLKEINDKYRHPLWTRVGEEGKKVGGHGGMDFVMDWRTIYCLRNGEPLDQDVYDGVTWSAVGPLSEWSVAHRSQTIDFPDFTRGEWEKTQPLGIVS